jgi:hypothetical protein
MCNTFVNLIFDVIASAFVSEKKNIHVAANMNFVFTFHDVFFLSFSIL